jgi:hypothetical protein
VGFRVVPTSRNSNFLFGLIVASMCLVGLIATFTWWGLAVGLISGAAYGWRRMGSTASLRYWYLYGVYWFVSCCLSIPIVYGVIRLIS